jgi:hypothetical protein
MAEKTPYIIRLKLRLLLTVCLWAASVLCTGASPAFADALTLACAAKAGYISVGYFSALTASGGTAPYAYSLTAGSLPPGLALNAKGSITGKPTKEGTYPFTAKVVDSTGASVTTNCNITTAQVNDIPTFVGCLNSTLTMKENLGSKILDDVTIADTVQCLPQGCKLTANLRAMSAQKGSTVTLPGDVQVQLPHVMLNCPGPAAGKGLRVRPAYTLAPQGAPSNSVEIGEDTGPPVEVQVKPYTFSLRKLVMADLLVGKISVAGQEFNYPPPYDLDGSIETPANGKRCASCHNSFGKIVDPGTKAYGPNNINAQLSFENDPFGVVRKDVGFGNVLPTLIFTTEPTKKKAVNPTPPFIAQTLDSVCTDIKNNLNNFDVRFKASYELSSALCNKLVEYQKERGCGTGKTVAGKNRVCMGVSGGGTFKNDQNQISSVVVDFSGQATNDGANIVFLDWDGALSAVNYMKHTTIQSFVLSSLTGTKIDAGFVLTANGKAQVSQDGAAPGLKSIKVTLDIGKTAIKITDSDNGDAVLVDAKTGVLGAKLNLN